MQPDQQTKNTRRILIIVIIALLLLVGWQVGIAISRRGLVKLSVEAVPHDSTVTLDGKKISSNGTTYVTPGTYTITASRQYFTSVSEQVNTEEQGEDTVYLLPEPKSPEGFDWLKQHNDIQQYREEVAGIVEHAKQEAMLKRYPILSDLPVKEDTFEIDYRVDGTAVTFIVTPEGNDTGKSISDALDYLKTNNIDTKSNTIVTSNLDTLLDFGLTDTQVDHFKDAVDEYAKSLHQPLTTSVIVDGDVQSAPLDDSGNFGVDFALNMNGKLYKAGIRYSGLDTTKVTLQNKTTGKVVFNKSYTD